MSHELSCEHSTLSSFFIGDSTLSHFSKYKIDLESPFNSRDTTLNSFSHYNIKSIIFYFLFVKIWHWVLSSLEIQLWVLSPIGIQLWILSLTKLWIILLQKVDFESPIFYLSTWSQTLSRSSKRSILICLFALKICMYECMKTLSFWLFECMHVHVWMHEILIWFFLICMFECVKFWECIYGCMNI